jgi:hypothetical protein
MRKPWSRGAGLLALTALSFVFLGLAAWAAEVLTVIQKEAAIRKYKRNYAPKVAELKEGDQPTPISSEPPWYLVEWKGVKGYLNASAVTGERQVVLSGEAAEGGGVRVTEQSAARRGFDSDVEREHKGTQPNLVLAYDFIDKVLKEWNYPENLIVKFLEGGKLAEFAAGGQK